MTRGKISWRLLPLVIFIGLSLFLYQGLSLDPHKLPSVLLDKPLPDLSLPLLESAEKKFSADSMKGKVWLLNVWATWCNACQEEHPVLMDLAQQGVNIIGLDYKDNSAKAEEWLVAYGSPFLTVLSDTQGDVAIDLGVYGAPETFIIDKFGVIKYKHVGEVTQHIWTTILQPIMKKLDA